MVAWIKSYIWSFIALVLAFATLFMMFDGGTSTLREVVSFCFLLFGPGIVYVRLLKLENSLLEFSLAIALSLSLETLLSQFFVLTGRWSIEIQLIILVGITVLGVVVQIITGMTRRFFPAADTDTVVIDTAALAVEPQRNETGENETGENETGENETSENEDS